MRAAFIIMQIGDPELDTVCEDFIVPVLQSCGLDPKRVDKHNEGRLLKSEIVEFIESSDIIVADLTNERPNCYLEVGYTMGLDKFRNLILTAREDHNPDSPNYQKGGHKIHFDLSGYDILFWDPKNLNGFREDLEKRVKRRLAIIEPYTTAPHSYWDEEWISEHRVLAFSGLKKLNKSGFMEIRAALPDFRLNVAQGELLHKAKAAQINTFGWPIGVVIDKAGLRPIPRTDGIVAEVAVNEGDSHSGYDYWALRKDGAFYLLKSLFEDKRKPGHLFFNTRIVRITETLLYCIRLYSGLGVPLDSRILVGIRHGGLKGRVLSTSSIARRVPPPTSSISTEDEVYSEVGTTLEKIESDLVNVVQEFTQPLFVVFDFSELDKKVLENIVNSYVAGKVI